jgi:hypothetical protein
VNIFAQGVKDFQIIEFSEVFNFPILNFQEFPPNFYFFTITFRDAALSKNLGGPVVMWWA